MMNPKTDRFVTHGIAVLIGLVLIFYSLIAPALLALGVLYAFAALILLLLEGKLDRAYLTLSFASLGTLVAVYFLPLWIADVGNHTPEDHLILAERFARRGQIFGDPEKAQAHLRLAAEGGSLEGQRRLGEALWFGHYGAVDRSKGLEWLRAAAANGHVGARELIKLLEAQ